MTIKWFPAVVVMASAFVVASCGGPPSPSQVLAMVVAQTEEDAMNACEGAILAMATNRSSVKFTSPHPRERVTVMPDGHFVVYTKFLAKNAYGAESMSMARCEIAGGVVIDLATTDSR